MALPHRCQLRTALWLLLPAFAAYAGLRPATLSAQAPQCTATATVTAPSGASLCQGVAWIVAGVEGTGPHPGKTIEFGSTPVLTGVCSAAYSPCSDLQTQESVELQETDAWATIGTPSVTSAGKITVSVTTYQPTAVASPLPCKCTDPWPQGYTSVQMGPTTQITQDYYGNC
jgi:hypothetical protein